MRTVLARLLVLVAALATLGLTSSVAVAAPPAERSAPSSVSSVSVGRTDDPTTSSADARRTPEHWSYNFKYNIGRTTPKKAKKALHDCFNCDFPVKGAPKGFPKAGQDLPLRAGPFGLGNFHCTFREEHSGGDQGGPYFGFTFDTAKGHVDGKGAWIAFTFSTNSNGENILNVFGYVSKNTYVPEKLYKNRANAMWKKFGKNIAS
jgi:hypothetical protein